MRLTGFAHDLILDAQFGITRFGWGHRFSLLLHELYRDCLSFTITPTKIIERSARLALPIQPEV